MLNRYVCKQKKKLCYVFTNNANFFRKRAMYRSHSQEGTARRSTTSFPQQYYHQESINLYDTASGRLVTNPLLFYQQHQNRDDVTVFALECIMSSLYFSRILNSRDPWNLNIIITTNLRISYKITKIT